MEYLKKRQAYENQMKAIAAHAQATGQDPAQVAMKLVEKERNAVEDFVRRHGEVPKDSIEALTAQAAIIHENNVAIKQASGVPDYIVAENAVLHDYSLDEYSGEADEFDAATLGSIFTGAVGAIKGINANRAEKGKPPLLAGKKKKALFYKEQEAKKAAEVLEVQQPNTETQPQIFVKKPVGITEQEPTYTPIVNQPDTPGEKTGLGIVIDEVGDAIRKKEQNDFLKKNLPIILVAVLVIFFIGRKMK